RGAEGGRGGAEWWRGGGRGRGQPRRGVRRRGGPFVVRMTAAVVAAGIPAAVVWVTAFDQIAAQLYSRLAPGAVTAIPVERSLLPPASAPPPPSASPPPTVPPEPSAPSPPSVPSPASAPREPTSTPPESRALADRPTAEPRAPVAVRQSPSVSSPIDGRPRTVVEPGAPAALRAPTAAARASSEPRTPIESRISTEPPTPAEPGPRSEPRAAIESSAPIERRAAPDERRASPGEPPSSARSDRDATDGSAAIDWLLKDRR